MMEYKGYIAKVSLDHEARVFRGEIINMSDVVTFEVVEEPRSRHAV